MAGPELTPGDRRENFSLREVGRRIRGTERLQERDPGYLSTPTHTLVPLSTRVTRDWDEGDS